MEEAIRPGIPREEALRRGAAGGNALMREVAEEEAEGGRGTPVEEAETETVLELRLIGKPC